MLKKCLKYLPLIIIVAITMALAAWYKFNVISVSIFLRGI